MTFLTISKSRSNDTALVFYRIRIFPILPNMNIRYFLRSNIWENVNIWPNTKYLDE